MRRKFATVILLWFLLLWSSLAFADPHKPIIWTCDPGTIAYYCVRVGLPMPVLAMPFWENSGGKTYDYSGNQNTGINYGASWVANGLKFDGSNTNYINLGQPDSLDITGDITVIALTTLTSNGTSERSLVGKGDFQYMLRWGSTSKFVFFVHDSDWHSVASNDVTSFNVPYMVAGRLKGTEVSIWVDGIKQNDTTTGGITTNASDVNIGRNSDNITRLHKGIISVVYIFPVALSKSQIQILYNDPYGMLEPIPMTWYDVAPPVGELVTPFGIGLDIFEVIQ